MLLWRYQKKNLLELRRRSILILQVPNLIRTQRPAKPGLKAARDGLVSLVIEHTIEDICDFLMGVSGSADDLESEKKDQKQKRADSRTKKQS